MCGFEAKWCPDKFDHFLGCLITSEVTFQKRETSSRNLDGALGQFLQRTGMKFSVNIIPQTSCSNTFLPSVSRVCLRMVNLPVPRSLAMFFLECLIRVLVFPRDAMGIVRPIPSIRCSVNPLLGHLVLLYLMRRCGLTMSVVCFRLTVLCGAAVHCLQPNPFLLVASPHLSSGTPLARLPAGPTAWLGLARFVAVFSVLLPGSVPRGPFSRPTAAAG